MNRPKGKCGPQGEAEIARIAAILRESFPEPALVLTPPTEVDGALDFAEGKCGPKGEDDGTDYFGILAREIRRLRALTGYGIAQPAPAEQGEGLEGALEYFARFNKRPLEWSGPARAMEPIAHGLALFDAYKALASRPQPEPAKDALKDCGQSFGNLEPPQGASIEKLRAVLADCAKQGAFVSLGPEHCEVVAEYIDQHEKEPAKDAREVAGRISAIFNDWNSDIGRLDEVATEIERTFERWYEERVHAEAQESEAKL